MSTSKAKIIDICAATIQTELPDPVIFGDWIMNTREFVVVRVTLDSGTNGWAFTLTRDGAVAEQIRKTLAGIYRNTSVENREKTFYTAQRRSLASHSAGVGLRALSVVDLAVWDATARDEDISISQLLKGSRPSMPATAIIGYPPGKMGPVEVYEQVTSLYNAGWRRFKAPVGSTQQLTIDRLKAARLAAPDAWIGCDAAWIYQDVESAVALLEKLDDVRLGWFEDIFPPGNAEIVAQLRNRTSIPIAMGDEQGGIYYPEALINKKAVDVVRIDLTCMGGITGGRKIVDQCLAADVTFAAHMFAHVHSQVFGAWGFSDVPIEWGVPWTGVDPYADSLQQPTIETGGNMKALDEGPGFGNLVNFEWIHTQAHIDPDQIFQKM
jgi:L-alanine-DL-glutamate epimerase-like enolase superfamily enzyme